MEKYDENGFLQSSFTTTNTSFTDGNDITVFQIARYKVFAVPNDASLAESYSNEFKVIKRSVVSHPKAFTPNGDGLNDEYKVYGTYIKTFNLKVYNRWGVMVYETPNYGQGNNFFEGVSEGRVTVQKESELPAGTYFYILEYKNDFTGEIKNKKGYIYITR